MQQEILGWIQFLGLAGRMRVAVETAVGARCWRGRLIAAYGLVPNPVAVEGYMALLPEVMPVPAFMRAIGRGGGMGGAECVVEGVSMWSSRRPIGILLNAADGAGHATAWHGCT